MKVINLNHLESLDVPFYLSLEQYYLKHIEDEDIFFIWDMYEAIIYGKHQLIENEIDSDYVKEHNIPMYRRTTGGGTIYSDCGCFMYSFITKKTSKEQVFKKYLNKFLERLKVFNINAILSGRNDLMFNGKKFSGCSYYHNQFGSILHGTFLYDTNLDKLCKCLNVDETKLISKGIKSVKERVINLKDYFEPKISIEELKDYLKESFRTSVEVITKDSKIYNEVKEQSKLYLSDSWLKGNNPPFTFEKTKRLEFGNIIIRINVIKNIVKNVSILGDYIFLKDINEVINKLTGVNYTIDDFSKVLDSIDISEYIMDCSKKEFLSMCFN